MITVSVIMFFFSIYIIWLQHTKTIPNTLEKLFSEFQTIWYLPKVLLSPILAIKSIVFIVSRNFRIAVIRKSMSNLQFYIRRSIQNFSRLIDLAPQPILQYYGNMPASNSDVSIDYKEIENKKRDAPQKKGSRRAFLKNSSLLFASVPFGIVSYGSIKTTHYLEVHTAVVNLKHLPSVFNNFKIIHISDIHSGSFRSNELINNAVSTINGLEPDIVAITGDFVNYHYSEYDLISDAMSGIKSKYGCFGCLGNHDHFMERTDTDKLIAKIESSGVDLLINSNHLISLENENICIAGVDNTGYGQSFGDFDLALKNIENAIPTILLCHDPTNWKTNIIGKHHTDLMLAGHTHGGQAGINIFGNMITPAMFYYNQFAGLYKHNDQYLYINRGLGNSGIPIRVGVKPEISCVRLVCS